MRGWICEFCFKRSWATQLPKEWDFVWQSSVCPDCVIRVKGDGGYGVVRGGEYSSKPDPRAKYSRRGI
jgi:hypothetical protein